MSQFSVNGPLVGCDSTTPAVMASWSGCCETMGSKRIGRTSTAGKVRCAVSRPTRTPANWSPNSKSSSISSDRPANSKACSLGHRTPSLRSSFSLSAQTPARDWWYHGREHGQHIGFFRGRTLDYLAARLGGYWATDGQAPHFFSEKPIPPARACSCGTCEWPGCCGGGAYTSRSGPTQDHAATASAGMPSSASLVRHRP